MSNLPAGSECPCVSIVMAVYNGEAFIRHAIDSALAQTEPSLELIVVDDGSSDGTVAIVEERRGHDARVRLIAGKRQRGPGHARNAGIDAARGEWITVLDADDWYVPERLAKLLSAAQETGANLIADNQNFTVGEGERPHRRLIRSYATKPLRLTASGLLRRDVIGQTGNLGLLKPMIRRKSLLEHRIRYDETISIGEDFYLLLDCLQRIGDLTLVAEPLYYYRIHSSSISTSPPVERLLPVLEVQKARAARIDPETDPALCRQMRHRTAVLERYICCKVLASAFQRRQLRAVFRYTMHDPAVLYFAWSGLLRLLGRRASIRMSKLLPAFRMKTSLPESRA